MKIEKIEEELFFLKKEKAFTLSVNGKELKLNKWWVEENYPFGNDNEVDYEFDEASQKIVSAMSDEERDELDDFITDLE